jgi:hypothetical protein
LTISTSTASFAVNVSAPLLCATSCAYVYRWHEVYTNDGADVGGPILRLANYRTSAVANDVIGTLQFWSYDADGAHVGAEVKAIQDPYDIWGRATALLFTTTPISGSPTERLRIDTNGLICAACTIYAPILCATTCLSACLVCASTVTSGIVNGSTCVCTAYLNVPTNGATICSTTVGGSSLYTANLTANATSVATRGDACCGYGIYGTATLGQGVVGLATSGVGVGGCAQCCTGYSGCFYGGSFLVRLCSTAQSFTICNVATGSGTAAHLLASGQLVCVSSTRASKCCIAPWTIPAYFLDCFEPIRFLYCSGLNSGAPFIVGALADDMAKWAPEFVRCDDVGRPVSLHEGGLAIAALSGLKIERDERRACICSLEARIAALEGLRS